MKRVAERLGEGERRRKGQRLWERRKYESIVEEEKEREEKFQE